MGIARTVRNRDVVLRDIHAKRGHRLRHNILTSSNPEQGFELRYQLGIINDEKEIA